MDGQPVELDPGGYAPGRVQVGGQVGDVEPGAGDGHEAHLDNFEDVFRNFLKDGTDTVFVRRRQRRALKLHAELQN